MYPVFKSINDLYRITSSQIDKLENAVNVNFPKDYIYYIPDATCSYSFDRESHLATENSYIIDSRALSLFTNRLWTGVYSKELHRNLETIAFIPTHSNVVSLTKKIYDFLLEDRPLPTQRIAFNFDGEGYISASCLLAILKQRYCIPDYLRTYENLIYTVDKHLSDDHFRQLHQLINEDRQRGYRIYWLRTDQTEPWMQQFIE